MRGSTAAAFSHSEGSHEGAGKTFYCWQMENMVLSNKPTSHSTNQIPPKMQQKPHSTPKKPTQLFKTRLDTFSISPHHGRRSDRSPRYHLRLPPLSIFQVSLLKHLYTGFPKTRSHSMGPNPMACKHSEAFGVPAFMVYCWPTPRLCRASPTVQQISSATQFSVL